MQDFRNLKAWAKGQELAVSVYTATGQHPKSELFGLTRQMRSAAVSISANLAEGCGRRGDREFARFVDIALGSAYEVASHLSLSHSLGYLDDATYAKLDGQVDEVCRMMVGLAKRLSRH